MSDKRVSDMTQAEMQDLAAPRPVTYQDAEHRYPGTVDARERFDALTLRGLLAQARGIWKPAATTTRRCTEPSSTSR